MPNRCFLGIWILLFFHCQPDLRILSDIKSSPYSHLDRKLTDRYILRLDVIPGPSYRNKPVNHVEYGTVKAYMDDTIRISLLDVQAGYKIVPMSGKIKLLIQYYGTLTVDKYSPIRGGVFKICPWEKKHMITRVSSRYYLEINCKDFSALTNNKGDQGFQKMGLDNECPYPNTLIAELIASNKTYREVRLSGIFTIEVQE